MGEDAAPDNSYRNNPINQVVNLLPLMAGKESPSGLELTREEATAQLWTLALKYRHTCQELSKTNYVDIAGKLLETGLPEEQHVASGLLAVLADDDDFSNLPLLFRTITEARVSSFMKRTFQVDCPHDRSKGARYRYVFSVLLRFFIPIPIEAAAVQITGAQLFLAMTTKTQSVNRLAPLVPSILCLLSASTPTWVNLKVAHEAAARGLLNMIHAAYDPATRLRHPLLLDTLFGPLLAPEGLPILLKAITRGSVDMAAKAAACLYQAVKHMEGDVDMLTPKIARDLLVVALVAEPERRAYVVGTLAEVACQDSVKELIGEVGGCETITRVLKSVLQTSSGKSAGLSSLPPFVALVVQFGTMLTRQLAYMDSNKHELLQAGAAPLLVIALKSKNMIVHENCTSALWHLGLEPDGNDLLKAASAPRFLTDAVPRTWIATDNDPSALPTRADIDAGGKPRDPHSAFDPTWDTPSQVAV